MLTATALAFAVNIAGALFNWIFQKAGRVTTQVVIFSFALIAALYARYGSALPSLQEWVQTAIVIFSLAVSFYEVILNYFPAFSGPTNSTN